MEQKRVPMQNVASNKYEQLNPKHLMSLEENTVIFLICQDL